ncbi:hypothetical protein QLL95_gp0488 [Cotonvirus japonicus]|uniref:Uncharacterized protein n=1 Tax=Cotonvirus japonicus TaxID=2811091 RepID=A0ABM7NTZ7_9VIRU|nr:hypothetical protein QLL95_gp0488 [Cotonvirus japonicus]BCS83635.1 hypothetical protein [Cotonvirus japonicus]
MSKKKSKKINKKSQIFDSESDSDSENDFNDNINMLYNEKLEKVPEFQYKLEDLMEDSKKCLICQNKLKTKTHDLSVCKSCFYFISINKSQTKRTYKLNDNDLTKLTCFEYDKRNGDTVYLYLLVDVKLMMIEKKYGVFNPNLDQYIACLNNIETENIENAKKKKQDSALREKVREERKKLIDKELNEKNIKCKTYHQESYYKKYIQNPKASLKNAIAKIEEIHILKQEEKQRKIKLETEMKKHNYNIHSSKDPYIDDYIIDNDISFDKCIERLLRGRKKFRS